MIVLPSPRSGSSSGGFNQFQSSFSGSRSSTSTRGGVVRGGATRGRGAMGATRGGGGAARGGGRKPGMLGAPQARSFLSGSGYM